MSISPAGATQSATATQSAVAEVWQVIVWDDAINLMSYVTYVFMTHFRYSRSKSERLMMQVHSHGRAQVAAGELTEMEAHVVALHGFGLNASLEQAV